MSTNIFTKEGFEFKGVKYRPMTAATLAVLETAESPFFTGDGGNISGLLDFLLVHSRPIAEMRKLSQDKEAFADESFTNGEQFSTDDLQQLAILVSQENEMIAQVLVEPETAQKKMREKE